MIKDRALKFNLIKYFVYKYWYPQIEVNVLSKQRISNIRKLVTDIDVLGLYPDVTGYLKLVLGDCKTLKGQSPITRTLWMKGLIEYIGAEKGIIILSKEVEKEHQMTSSDLGINLLSEQDFEIYSKHTVNYLEDIRSALIEPDSWDKFFDISAQYSSLKSLQEFGQTTFWNETTSSNKLRNALFVMRQYRGELNPSKESHLAILLNHFSLIAIAMNDIINKIFNRYLLPSSKPELENDLKVIIWGGIENYEYLNELRKKITNSVYPEKDLTLPLGECVFRSM